MPTGRPAIGTDAAAVAQWAAERLRVPAGHPRAGQPIVLAPWQIAIIDDALTLRETLACMARKNAKSATVAVLALAHLVGPLRRPGWRCGVLSVNRGKAGELRQQIEDIAVASGFRCALPGHKILNPDLTFRMTPWPGRVIGDNGSRVEIEGAGHASASGHSAGYDLAVVDEIGLLQERHRAAVAGMRSSVSAKGGRFLSISIHGDGPFIPEILSRRGAAGWRSITSQPIRIWPLMIRLPGDRRIRDSARSRVSNTCETRRRACWRSRATNRHSWRTI